jgi:hypothetical protein
MARTNTLAKDVFSGIRITVGNATYQALPLMVLILDFQERSPSSITRRQSHFHDATVTRRDRLNFVEVPAVG